jgi:tetratricopeptide (TPR) repeat protein
MIDRSRRVGVLVATAMFAFAVALGGAFAAGGGGDPDTESRYPSQPKTTTTPDSQKATKSHKRDKKAEQDFIDGYRAARLLVLAGDYQQGIAAFKALDRDDHPDVANYIGYANRKLGNYELARVWYEKALASDPNHVRTWQYYGMWHVEQGNMLKAADFLEKIRLICAGTACQEYQDLKAAMEGKISY